MWCPIATHTWAVCVFTCVFITKCSSTFPSTLSSGCRVWRNNETWVWEMSVNAVSLTHIPLSPPTDWLALFPSSPAFVLAITTPLFYSIVYFSSHLHLSLVSLPLLAHFSNPCLSFAIYSFSFLHKESFSLIFFIPLLLPRILISSCWYSLLCPLLFLHVTASWYKMAGTF